jgi:ABC-type tungstate transport system permease subunit
MGGFTIFTLHQLLSVLQNHRIKLACYVARMRRMINAYAILVINPQGKPSHEEDNKI